MIEPFYGYLNVLLEVFMFHFLLLCWVLVCISSMASSCLIDLKTWCFTFNVDGGFVFESRYCSCVKLFSSRLIVYKML